MREELEKLGFHSKAGQKVMEWAMAGEGVAIAYLGNGIYNISIFNYKKEWEWYGGIPKEEVMHVVNDYMKRRKG